MYFKYSISITCISITPTLADDDGFGGADEISNSDDDAADNYNDHNVRTTCTMTWLL